MKAIRRGYFIVAVCLLLSAAVLLPGAASASAGPYTWNGGHDTTGCTGPSEHLYFAEGTTRNGFEEYLLLRNPNQCQASVTVKYQFPDCGPGAHLFSLEPLAGVCLCVNQAVGPGRDVSVEVEASPGVLAERQVFFNYKGVWTGGHVSGGVPAPLKRWYFAEGTTRNGFREWLCLQNPNQAAADVTLTYMLGTGENRQAVVTIPGGGRSTVDVNTEVGADQDVSILVESAAPVVAERPMYFDYKCAWRGGHTCVGTPEPGRRWYFAEGTTLNGFEEWLCVMNPGEETTALVEYMFAAGPPIQVEYTLGARSRTTIFVNEVVGPDRDVSVRLTSASDVVCERPMYFHYRGALEGGHVVSGSTGRSEQWLFGVTGTGDGFESWLCVMNPGAEDAPAVIEVRGEEGSVSTQEVVLPALSRTTFDLTTAASGKYNPWVAVEAEAGLVVERPTYFAYQPKVEPEPFTLATWAGIEIKSPVRYCDLAGAVFHEASREGSGGKPSNSPPMQPVGTCLRDDNPARRAPGIIDCLGDDPYYFVEDSRGRGTYSTTACDVMAKAGSIVYAPVSGVVLAAEGYLLYGSYPDLRVKILIDGVPRGYQMAVLHMSQLLVTAGQWVEAGVTPIGVVRDLVPYFHSGPNPYTREEGNHPHIQINYRPDEIGGGTAGEAVDGRP